MTRYRPRPAKGFTMIELLIVVAVIAMLAGLGGGLYYKSYRRLLVEKAARDLRLMARYARIAAIEQHQVFYLVIDRQNSKSFVATEGFFSGSQTEPAGIVSNPFCRPVSLPEGIRFEDVIAGPGQQEEIQLDGLIRIRFMPNGTADSAVVVVGDGQTHYALIVNGATGSTHLVMGQADLLSEQLVVDLEAG